jgi:hypothetical protein
MRLFSFFLFDCASAIIALWADEYRSKNQTEVPISLMSVEMRRQRYIPFSAVNIVSASHYIITIGVKQCLLQRDCLIFRRCRAFLGANNRHFERLK